MGTSKAWLEWHGRTLLAHVALTLGRSAGSPLIVVRAPGQELPPLPETVEIAEDPEEGQGPLQGIAAGLAAVGERADVAFVSAVDAPFLTSEFVAAVVRSLRPEDEIAVPVHGGRSHPLAAAYRTSVLPTAQRLLEAGERRATALVEASRARELDADALPGGADCLVNLNAPADYETARERPFRLAETDLG